MTGSKQILSRIYTGVGVVHYLNKRVNLLVLFFITAQTIWPKDFKEFEVRE